MERIAATSSKLKEKVNSKFRTGAFGVGHTVNGSFASSPVLSIASGRSTRDDVDEVFHQDFFDTFAQFTQRAAVAIPSASKFLLPQDSWSFQTAQEFESLSAALGPGLATDFDRKVISQMPIDKIPFAGKCKIDVIGDWSKSDSNPYYSRAQCNPQAFATDILRHGLFNADFFDSTLELGTIDIDDLVIALADDSSKKVVSSVKITHNDYYDSIVELMDSSVFEITTDGDADKFYTAYGRFFKVPKKNLKARAIVDCTGAGLLWPTPPPVNLPSIATLLGFVGMSRYFWVGDWKHWYYSLPIQCKKLRSLFTVRVRGMESDARLQVLPQGWSWSSYLAQAVSWGIILFTSSSSPPLADPTDVPSSTLPHFIPIRERKTGEVCGCVCVWYDNILVCSYRKEDVQLWLDRIRQNSEELCAHWSDPEPKLEPSRECEYIGICIKSTDLHTSWWHPEKKVAKALKLWMSPINTCRIIQRILGVAVWDHMVRLQPLHLIREALNLHSVYTSGVAKHALDDPIQCKRR